MKGSLSIKEESGEATIRSGTILAVHTENTLTGVPNILKNRPLLWEPTYWPVSLSFSLIRIILKQPTKGPWASYSFQGVTVRKDLMLHVTGPYMQRLYHIKGSKTFLK